MKTIILFTCTIIIISLLLLLLLLQKREIKRITKELQTIQSQNSNGTVHCELSLKEFQQLIEEINTLLLSNRQKRIFYEQQNVKLKKMITNISHDLRTPLTSALGYIDMLLQSPLPEEEKERELAIIQSRLYRMNELLNSFFEFSQVISTDQKPVFSSLNLIGILEESIIHFYDDFSCEKRQIIFNHSVSYFKIFSHKDMLIRIFDNIISNARKHGSGDLEITFESNQRNFKITFCNLLPQETDSTSSSLYSKNLDVAHIFDEFYTADVSHSNGNTGLGLAIAKEFSQILGLFIGAKLENNKLYLTLEKK